jgi:hypothetical protein
MLSSLEQLVPQSTIADCLYILLVISIPFLLSSIQTHLVARLIAQVWHTVQRTGRLLLVLLCLAACSSCLL